MTVFDPAPSDATATAATAGRMVDLESKAIRRPSRSTVTHRAKVRDWKTPVGLGDVAGLGDHVSNAVVAILDRTTVAGCRTR